MNTKPLLYGIMHHEVINDIDLVVDYPAKIAQLLINDKIDVGLIPVAAITKLASWQIITDYCIGSDGPVASVCLFSEVPMEQIETVILDYQSRTSVSLARILLKEYWKKEVVFVDASGEDFRKEIKGHVAGVVIGDRALQQRLHSTYIFDLGEAWKAHTGLPFVFAAWVSNKQLPEKFIRGFNEANAKGLLHLDAVIKENPFAVFDLKKYFGSYISYELTKEKKKGLELFLEKLDSI